MIRLSQDDKPLSAKMIRNVGFGGLRALAVLPIPFLLTPLILRKIGPRGYGTWALLVTINTLTSLADLGLLGTLSKYVAEYHARRDYVKLSRLLSSGLVIFGLLASAMMAILWVASHTIVERLFRGSPFTHGELLHFFHCAIVLVWINIMMFLFSSVTSGLQRLDLTNLITALNVVCAALAGAGLLLKGLGIQGLLYANIGSGLLALLVYCCLLRKLLPEVRMNPFLANLDEVKKIFAFSLQIYLTQAAVAIHNHIEKIFLAFFVGVIGVGWYDIASDVALKVRGASGLLLSPVLPAAAELDALGEDKKVAELYYRAHKYLAFVSVPVVFFLVAISARFVELWIGPSFRVVALPLAILLLINLFNLTTGPGYMILAGKGILRPGMYSALVGIAINIPLSYILIRLFGFRGAVAGTSVSLAAGGAFFLYLFHRYERASASRLVREAYLKPVLFSLILLILEFHISPAAGLSWFGLFLQGGIFVLVYGGLLISTKFFDPYDWTKIESVLPISRVARRIVPAG
jgi:O-antigen/teichoic acid export membrane protein